MLQRHSLLLRGALAVAPAVGAPVRGCKPCTGQRPGHPSFQIGKAHFHCSGKPGSTDSGTRWALPCRADLGSAGQRVIPRGVGHPGPIRHGSGSTARRVDAAGRHRRGDSRPISRRGTRVSEDPRSRRRRHCRRSDADPRPSREIGHTKRPRNPDPGVAAGYMHPGTRDGTRRLQPRSRRVE